MNVAEQVELGRRLDEALRSVGIAVDRIDVVHGNVRSWSSVDGASIIGRLMAVTGWRVRLTS